MGNSGITWVDVIFDWAVYLLADIAKLLGISYEELNIWMFLVAWPLLTTGMAIWIAVLIAKCRKYRRTASIGYPSFGHPSSMSKPATARSPSGTRQSRSTISGTWVRMACK